MTRTTYRIAALAALVAVSANAAAAANLPRNAVAAQMERNSSSKALSKAQKGLQQIAKFDCRAQGTPVEFPDDLVIVNKGAGTIAAGTKVNWRMENSFVQGSYVLPALAPNQHVFVNHANPGGLPAGAKCFVWIVK